MESKTSKKTVFCLLSPDYTHIDLKEYKPQEKWEDMKYSQLYNFYEKHKNKIKDETFFRDEFLSALKKQSKPVDNSLEEELFYRFSKMVGQ